LPRLQVDHVPTWRHRGHSSHAAGALHSHQAPAKCCKPRADPKECASVPPSTSAPGQDGLASPQTAPPGSSSLPPLCLRARAASDCATPERVLKGIPKRCKCACPATATEAQRMLKLNVPEKASPGCSPSRPPLSPVKSAELLELKALKCLQQPMHGASLCPRPQLPRCCTPGRQPGVAAQGTDAQSRAARPLAAGVRSPLASQGSCRHAPPSSPAVPKFRAPMSPLHGVSLFCIADALQQAPHRKGCPSLGGAHASDSVQGPLFIPDHIFVSPRPAALAAGTNTDKQGASPLCDRGRHSRLHLQGADAALPLENSMPLDRKRVRATRTLGCISEVPGNDGVVAEAALGALKTPRGSSPKRQRAGLWDGEASVVGSCGAGGTSQGGSMGAPAARLPLQRFSGDSANASAVRPHRVSDACGDTPVSKLQPREDPLAAHMDTGASLQRTELQRMEAELQRRLAVVAPDVGAAGHEAVAGRADLLAPHVGRPGLTCDRFASQPRLCSATLEALAACVGR
jgi:hypothetical protein